MVCILKCGIMGYAALQNPEEKAGQIILNFNGEVVWSSFDHAAAGP
jgi:hypothetical protein